MKSYEYVGTPEILLRVTADDGGSPIRNRADLEAWLRSQGRQQNGLSATYIVRLDGVLVLAERQSEHVVCAGGAAVLGAGELSLEWGDGFCVSSVTNQSTGYCPDAQSWSAVEMALSKLDVPSPSFFTPEFVFRRCTQCGQIAVVKNDEFFCSVCDAELPAHWNF